MSGRLQRLLMLAAIAVALTGCATSAPVPEDRFYDIEVPAPAARSRTVLRGGLLVERLQADALRAGRAILYRDIRRPLELNRYHYRFWSQQPHRLIQQRLADYLRIAGVADHVYTGEEALPHRYRLTGRLLAFDRQVGDGRAGMKVALQFTLGRHGGTQPLLEKTYRAEVPAEGDDMHASALAARQALAGIFHTLAEDLAGLALVSGP